MKLQIIITIGCLILVYGCNGFLEESSQSEIRPSTVSDMEQLLLGEVYMPNGEWKDYFDITELFTDEMQCNGLQDEKRTDYRTELEEKRWLFVWDKQMYAKDGGGNNRFVWERPYECIKGCNVILEYLDQVRGDDQLREYLRGEALVMRAYYYFNLVNLFGEPYNAGDPAQNLGVPLKLHMAVTDEVFARNTVAEVYRQVETDLQTGVRLMKNNPIHATLFRMNHLGAWALLSRLNLYRENWDQALRYADSVLMEKPGLLNLASLQDNFDLSRQWASYGVYSSKMPDEIIWACRTEKSLSSTDIPPFSISRDFFKSYEFDYTNTQNLGDLRGYFYFQYYSYVANKQIHYEPLYVSKDLNSGTGERNSGIRTAELYLNRAEVNVRKYMESGDEAYRAKALADLNYLRKHRYDTRHTDYLPLEERNDLDLSTPEKLFAFYKAERARELCGEGFHRWFDLRRYGKPGLTHLFFIEPGKSEEVYTLPEGGLRYLLPIPEAALDVNSKLQQNP